MKSLLKNKAIVLWLIIILLIANLSAVITVYVKIKEKSPEPGILEIQRRNPMLGSDIPLHQHLNFSELQFKSFQQLRNAYRNETKTLDYQMHLLRLEIGNELAKENPDSVELNRLAKEFGQLQSKIKQKAFRHFTDVKSICNKKQKQIFNSHIINIVESQKPGPGKQHQHRFGRKRKFNK